MAENNDLLKVPFIRETDGCWHLRYQSNGDPVFFHIDSGTKKFEANILTTHIGLVENRVEFMDRPSFLNGTQSREFFLDYNEGIYVDLRSNVPVSYCGILGSLEQSELPVLDVTSTDTSASISITDSEGNDLYTGDDRTVYYSTNGGYDLMTYDGEAIELTEAGEYDVISYCVEDGKLPDASEITHIVIEGEEPEPLGPTPDEPDYLCFTANKAGATLRMTGVYSEDYSGDDFALEYSRDGETWQDWTFTKGVTEDGMIPCVSDTLTFAAIGDKVYLRGDNDSGTTTLALLIEGTSGYSFQFAGGEGTQASDNEFSVTGDLQTIKDKTGQDKVAPCFAVLFNDADFNDFPYATPSILITSAPDLTATTLTNCCYYMLFVGQLLLKTPAEMHQFTMSQLLYNDHEDTSSAFYGMYMNCGLTEPFVFSELSLLNDGHDFQKLSSNFSAMYSLTNLPLTNDNGNSLLCFPNITFPISGYMDGDFLTFIPYNFVFLIFNGLYEPTDTNGFTLVSIHVDGSDNSEWLVVSRAMYLDGDAYAPTEQSSYDEIHTMNWWIPTNDSVSVELYASSGLSISFVKWQSSSDGETWTDIPGATSSTYTATLTQAGDYYYKAVFEQEQPQPDYLYFEAVEANSTVSIWSDLETAPNLEYSRDGVTWQEWQYTTDYSVHTFNTITLSAVGDRVYLRGNNPDGLGFYDDEDEISYHSNFSLTGSIMAGGNIMSLLDKTMMMTEVPDYGFKSLFYKYNEPVPLLTPPDMSTITSIGYDGCYNMYQDCISLTAAANMSSLTTIGIGGCSHMYINCTSLTTAADMPSLTTIGASGCDAMYEECTFDMSNDGTTLNFAFPTPPVIVGSNTYATAYDIADWMGNTNGFTTP